MGEALITRRGDVSMTRPNDWNDRTCTYGGSPDDSYYDMTVYQTDESGEEAKTCRVSLRNGLPASTHRPKWGLFFLSSAGYRVNYRFFLKPGEVAEVVNREDSRYHITVRLVEVANSDAWELEITFYRVAGQDYTYYTHSAASFSLVDWEAVAK